MILGPVLEDLAKRWEEAPSPTLFAALADGMRKCGALAEAANLVAQGLERYPSYTPGIIVGIRVAIDQHQIGWAEAALRGLLEANPRHPVARELARQVAPGLLDKPHESADLVYAGGEDSQSGQETREGGDEPEIVTESLAALYRQQGHLDQALAAYTQLTVQQPENQVLLERRESVRQELLCKRPLPFDSRESGGQSLSELLNQIVSAEPEPGQRKASFDSFFDPPPAPKSATNDFDAFQEWLKELDR